MNISDLESDLMLDSTIKFPHSLSTQWAEPKSVFLTGASGFLGAYLLSQLLHRTNAVIYCLIRSENIAKARARLQQHLQFYGLWQELFSTRIVPVIGDLSKPYLALSLSRFDQLSEQIDIIFHNGAQVNSSYSYARLRASNVLGTQEVLRLAGGRRTKPVHFVSTLAVFFSDNYSEQLILESDVAGSYLNLKGGYKQSKYVAEGLIRQAQQRGLPTVIYRCGRIWGDSQTGIMSRFSDLLCTLVQCAIHLGSFPKVEATLNIASVDYVSQAIVHLGLQKSSLHQTFHLHNPYSTAWQDLWDMVNACNYSIVATGFPQWTEEIKQKATQQRQNKLYSIVRHLLRSPIYLFARKPQFDNRQAQIELTKAAITCPVVDVEFIKTYLSYFQQNSYIPSFSNGSCSA